MIHSNRDDLKKIELMGEIFKNIITGEFITLRKTTIADAESIFEWRSGPSGQYLRQPPGYSVQSQRDWINSRPDTEINYVIYDNTTEEKVGAISIYDVNSHDRIANVGRLLLGSKWLTKSNPFGLESLLLCYGYVFQVMKFRKITGDIMASNSAMYKLQIFLGMKEEGLLTRHVFVNEQYNDLHIMSLFAEEFGSTYSKRLKFLLKAFK